MAAGAAFLRTRPDIDPARVGLVGNSQAGWIIPVAAERANPAFMILLVGPTVSVGIENFYSNIVEFSDTPIEKGYEALPSFNGNPGFDPKPVLEKLNVPGLWLLAGEDRSIPTPATVAILDRLIAAGHPFERVVFAGAGHDLRSANYWPEIDRWLGKVLH
jgi:dienelactone hydrolase